jgi:threonyl-tRNA synthetase
MWKAFGFEKLRYYLSTKPEKAVGENVLWEKAIVSLRNALERENIEYEVDEGEGIFYGPKIDIKIKDALNRDWQMSTIQFDFNLPERFDMNYIGEDGKEHRPFMIHRALLGSIERFFGVLIEHFAGEFPLWLAPVQVAVFTISDSQKDYAKEIHKELVNANIRVLLDERNEKIGYKIREAETKKIPYMIILGDKEKENRNISLRQHRKGDLGNFELKEFIKKVTFSIKEKLNKDYF